MGWANSGRMIATTAHEIAGHRVRGSQPDNAGCGQNELKDAQHELRTDGRHAPDLLNGVSALGQIRDKSAEEIVIRQTGELFQNMCA